MPVVPPMVSAASGALLIPHMPPGTGRTTMLYGCYAMFGLSLIAALIIIIDDLEQAGALRHVGHGAGAHAVDRARAAGPGHHRGRAARHERRAGRAARSRWRDGVFAILFGVPVWGFCVLWIALATALTVRTLRRGMPFALTWWSLTFPVGTFVTGTTQLAIHTGCPRSGRGRARVRRAARHLGTGRGAHRARQPGGQPVRAACHVRADHGEEGSPATGYAAKVKSPVLPSGRGVRRQHGANGYHRRPGPGVTPGAKEFFKHFLSLLGLENGRDALPACRADRDQAAHRLAGLLPSSPPTAWPAGRRCVHRSRRTGALPPATSR